MRTPLGLVETIELPGVTAARTFIAFEDRFLVGEGGASPGYHLFDRTTGELLWSRPLAGTAEDPKPVPAVAGGLALLGAGSDGGVVAVEIATGAELWSDGSVGSMAGRHPILTGGLAVYHGANGLAAVEAETGEEVWRVAVSTAEAPLALFGRRLYVVTGEGSLQARDLFTGDLVWSLGDAGGDGSNVIATERFIFINNPSTRSVSAVLTRDGSVAWSVEAGGEFGVTGIALAYDLIFTFTRDESRGWIRAYRSHSGDLVWEAEDFTTFPIEQVAPVHGGPVHVIVADNRIYYWNSSLRIRVLDALSGALLWNIQFGSRAESLSLVDGQLLVLLEDRVQVYGPSNELYFPHIGDGGSPDARFTTLLTLTNLTSETATGTVHFLGHDGEALAVEVTGLGSETSFEFTIEPNETVSLETLGDREEALAGWARADSDRRISGTAVFRVDDGSTFTYEAGVSDSALTGSASVFVSRSEWSGNEISTGLALANPSNEPAEVTVELRRKTPTAVTVSQTVVLGSNEKRAEFLEELFPDEAEVGMEGTLVITADVPVVITALRTQNGFQMSSYPVGQPVR